MENFFDEYSKVNIEQNVVWGEMDAFQHINNTVYFRYFENVRLEYFHKINLFEIMKNEGIGPVLASTQCRFKIPLTFPDKIHIGTKVFELGEDYYLMKYSIYSHQYEKIVAEGEGKIVSFSFAEKKKSKHPKQLYENILALEGNQIVKK